MNVTESVANTPSNPSRTPHNESPSSASRPARESGVLASREPVSAAAASGARSCGETRGGERAEREGASVCGRGERDTRRGRGGVVGQRRVVVARKVFGASADRVFPPRLLLCRAERPREETERSAGDAPAACSRRHPPRGGISRTPSRRGAPNRARGMRGGYGNLERDESWHIFAKHIRIAGHADDFDYPLPLTTRCRARTSPPSSWPPAQPPRPAPSLIFFGLR